MKKLQIIGTCLLMLIFCNIAYSQEYTIETSKGPVLVVVPEGLTLAQAYQEMARLYLEERYDLEELQIRVDELLLQLEKSFQAEANYYLAMQKLINDYQKLRSLYEAREKRDNFQFILYGGVSFFEDTTIRLGIGVLLFKKMWIGIDYEIPKEIGVTFGIRLD